MRLILRYLESLGTVRFIGTSCKPPIVLSSHSVLNIKADLAIF